MKKSLVLIVMLTLSLSAKDITKIGSLMWEGGINYQYFMKQWVTDTHYIAKKYMNTSGDTATTYCSKLSLGGYDDWRLPTIKELKRIVSACGAKINTPDNLDNIDRNKANKSYQSCYKSKGFSYGYYSSTTSMNNIDKALVVNFENGFTGGTSKSFLALVRCVRR